MKSAVFKTFLIFVAAFCVILLRFGSAWAGAEPSLNNGSKWRLAYYEGGPYKDYQLTFAATLKGLAELGWIRESALPGNLAQMSNRRIWDHLASLSDLQYLEFLADGYYSADWDTDLRQVNREKMLGRLRAPGEVDLIMAMGTWAGQDLTGNRHSVPLFVMSTSDPVRSGIIKSPEDSGYDNVFARCDPKRYERQIRLFHRIVGFKKLGLVTADAPDGRVFSAWDELMKVGAERNFEVIPCYALETDVEEKEMIKNYRDCYRELSGKVDAIWITGANGNQARYIQNYIPILIEHKIPTWAMSQDSELIKKGIMLALAKSDFGPLGRFQAEAVAKILGGARPRDLNQVFEDMNALAINKKTAELIGFKIPNSLLRVSDAVFDRIADQ